MATHVEKDDDDGEDDEDDDDGNHEDDNDESNCDVGGACKPAKIRYFAGPTEERTDERMVLITAWGNKRLA